MEDREFSGLVRKVKQACERCLKPNAACSFCVYDENCIEAKNRDVLKIMEGYEKRLWAKTAEVERLKKALKRVGTQTPAAAANEEAPRPMIPENWYMDIARFIRRNLFVEIRCDESLEDIDYIRNVLDAEAAIRAAYGDGEG